MMVRYSVRSSMMRMFYFCHFQENMQFGASCFIFSFYVSYFYHFKENIKLGASYTKGQKISKANYGAPSIHSKNEQKENST
jgi:hypothetical protein